MTGQAPQGIQTHPADPSGKFHVPSRQNPTRPFLSLALVTLLLYTDTFVVCAQPTPSSPSPPRPEDYRAFALQQDGDAARGQELFADQDRLACAKCHSIDGQGSKAGPDLFSAGDQFARGDLIDAVLWPSATIAVGYATTLVETHSGDEHAGVLKEANDTCIELAGADGQRIRIERHLIAGQRGSALSLMPEGLQAGLSLTEFTDLIEYLVSLKEPAHALVNHRGMPEVIPLLEPQVTLRPLLPAPLQVGPAAVPGHRQVQTGLVWFAPIPGRAQTSLALDQSGVIWRLDLSQPTATPARFADFTREVFSARGPNGLLGMAFHPEFRQNRRYYLKHQVFEDGQIATVLVEKSASPDLLSDSGEPSRRLLKMVAVAEHHNGGCIQFGPDGYLYLGMGDSAPNHDPQGHGQDLRLLLGKMLRIDVDHRSGGQTYGIPADNPFLGRTDVRPEIWAWGLREPWRFSFDELTGDLWVADLGQERGDEVALVRRGENHGWNVYQGFERFSNQFRKEGVTYTLPLFSTRRKDGAAIIGGHVYRGDPQSSFYGVYIFGDYTSRRIWGLTQEQGSLQNIAQLATCPQSITAFATDGSGQIHVVGQQGMIYQLDLGTSRYRPTPSTLTSAATP